MAYERDNIRRMQGYVSGEQPLNEQNIKLNTNENPYPPAPSIEKIVRQFSSDSLRRYPPPTADNFRDLISVIHHVDRDNIIATRGGDELLRLLITTFVNPGESIGMTDPTYSLYPVLASIHDCPVVKVALREDWSLPEDFAQQVNAAGCKLTFLVNPHAPSGKLLSVKQLAGIAENLDSVLLIDEAYVDFVAAEHHYDAIPLINQFDNIVILRTLSKGYSLAGLRFGYGIACKSLIEPMLNKTRDSYNLDLLSQQIAEAAIKDQIYALENCKKIIQQRAILAGKLTEMGLIVETSETNFLLTTIPENYPCSAENLYQSLKGLGILIRYFREPRLHDKVRITVGTAEQNNDLIRAIKQVLKF